jgi:hypothetical protein
VGIVPATHEEALAAAGAEAISRSLRRPVELYNVTAIICIDDMLTLGLERIPFWLHINARWTADCTCKSVRAEVLSSLLIHRISLFIP